MDNFEIPPLPIPPVSFQNSGKQDNRVTSIIDICEKHVFGQTTSVQGIINICSQMTGCEYYCNQIISFCNQIISETFQSSHTIINLCKTFSQIEVSNINHNVSNSVKEFCNSAQASSSSTNNSTKEFSSTIGSSSSSSSSSTSTTVKQEMMCDGDEDTGNENSVKKRSRKSVPSKFTPMEKDAGLIVPTEDRKPSEDNDLNTFDENAWVSDDEINQEDNPDWSAHWESKKMKEENEPNTTNSHDPDYNCSEDPDEQPEKKIKKKSKSPKTPKEILNCSSCKKRFTSKAALEKHEEFHKNGGKMTKNKGLLGFQCEQCGYVTKYQSEFINHARTHSGERPFICEICGNAYALMSTLKGHQLRHLDYKPEGCDFCDYRCSSKKELRVHVGIHSTEKKFQCDECGKRFARSGYLKTHLRSHMDIYPYQCQICHKKFRLRNHLRRHEKVHKEEMQYSCKICGKQSRQKYNITVHMRTHHGEKPYPCDLCGKQFAYNVTQRQHRDTCTGRVEVLLGPPLDL